MWCNKKQYLYVGRTNNPMRRYKQHLSMPGDVWGKVAEKYGKESIGMLVIKTGLTKSEAEIFEAKFIIDALMQKIQILNLQIPNTTLYNLSFKLINPSISEEEFEKIKLKNFQIPYRKIDYIPYPHKREKLLEII